MTDRTLPADEHSEAELRGLVRDLTTALENRNKEVAALKAQIDGHVLVPRSTASILHNCFVPKNPNKMRKAHPDVVKAAWDFKDRCRIVFGPQP